MVKIPEGLFRAGVQGHPDRTTGRSTAWPGGDSSGPDRTTDWGHLASVLKPVHNIWFKYGSKEKEVHYPHLPYVGAFIIYL